MRLKNKIIWLIVPIILLPMLASGWLSYSKLKTTAIDKSKAQMVTLLQQYSLYIYQFIRSAESNIRLFSNNELLRRYMVTRSQEERYEILQPLLMKQLLSYQRSYPEYYEFRVIFPDGSEDLRQVSMPVDNLAMDEADNPFIKTIMHYTQGTFSRIERNPDNGELALYVAIALNLKDKSIESVTSRPKFRGYLVMTIDISEVISQMDLGRLGDDGYVFTVNNSGKAELVPTRMRSALRGAGLNQQQMNGLEVGAGVLNKTGGVDSFSIPIIKTRFMDVEGYMKAAKIQDNFVVVTWLPVKEITGQTAKLGFIVVGVTVFAIMVTVLLLFGSLDYFVIRPIQKLRNSAIEISHGILTRPVKMRQSDEIGELGESFDDMRRSMLRSHQYLEQLVDERTAEVSKALELAKKASREKSNYLSRMSHELRTPLNAIIGFSQLYAYDDNMTEHQKINARKINNAGEYLLSLIDEILDLTKIEAGRIKLSMETVSLPEVIDNCCVLTEALASAHDVSIVFDSEQCEEIYVHADYIRMKQVILNLLSNAVKYNLDHGTVSIQCIRAGDDYVRVAVQDTGTGIPESKISQLFQPFDRLGAEYGNAEGTGIGLLITKQLVELMGGRMGADSEAGTGATFWVELKSSTKEAYSYIKESTDKSDRIEESPAVPAQHIRILVAEDNEVNRDVMHLQLGMLGYSADFAADGTEALEKWQSGDYHLLMTDIHMPNMDGYELVRRIHNTQKFARNKIPVIAITADAMEDQLKRCLDAGIDDYIVKPVDLENLQHVLLKWQPNRLANA